MAMCIKISSGRYHASSLQYWRPNYMTVMTFVIAYLGTAIAFFGLDFIWLRFIAKDFYFSQLGSLLKESPQLGYAGAFYIFYVAGIVYLAIMPQLSGGTWKTAALAGLVLGLTAYGTYDMTNMSTLKNWPLKMSLVDLAWGGFVTSVAATVGFITVKQFG